MAKDVTFTKDCEVITTRSAKGTPLGTVDYKAGWSGKIPEAHFEQAQEQGAVTENTSKDAPPAPQPAKAPADTSKPGTISSGVKVNDQPAPQVSGGG